VASFPETHFFEHVARAQRWRHGGWRRRVGLPLRDAHRAIDRLIALGVVQPGRQAGREPRTVGEYATVLADALDDVARKSGASHWLEKTPGHLRYVREIERHIPGSKIIHMIRSGPAVIASLHEAHRVRPDIWGPSPAVSRLVGVWRSDLRRSRACVGRPNHHFISYERLVADPADVLRRLCRFVELPADAATLHQMLSDFPSAGLRSTGSVRDPMPWKEDELGAPIQNRNARKFQTLFTPAERAEIERAVAREDPIMHSFPFL
jgi:hypothetical protein